MTPAKGSQDHFAIDAKASLFTVQAFASGIVAVIAHSPKFAIRDISGDVLYDTASIQNSVLRLSIRVASLEIMDEVTSAEKREIERVMFDEVLEKSVYQTAEFRSHRVGGTKIGENMYRASISGELTLHGVNRGLGFDSQLVVGEDTLRAQGSFSIMQSDYGLKIASVAGGTLKLKDELKFAFFLLARKQS